MLVTIPNFLMFFFLVVVLHWANIVCSYYILASIKGREIGDIRHLMSPYVYSPV